MKQTMKFVAVIMLALLATACNKPEKEKLAGTWRWTYSSAGGCFGETHTSESAGFEVEIVFTGGISPSTKMGKKSHRAAFKFNKMKTTPSIVKAMPHITGNSY